MTAAKSNNTLAMGALALGAFYLWRKSQAPAGDAPVTVTPSPAAPVAPVINITIPPGAFTGLVPAAPAPAAPTTPTTALQPVINLNPPAPLAPVVVQTDYGPVIPLQPTTAPPATAGTPAAACAAVNPTWTGAMCSDRLTEIPFRWQYILNSIADGRAEQNKYPAGNPAIAEIQGRMDTLASKGAALQAEWRAYNGGHSIPEGQLANAAWKAAYIAFLKARGWLDKSVGVV